MKECGQEKFPRRGRKKSRCANHWFGVAFILMNLTYSASSIAQTEYADKIRMYETVQPAGDAPFGENVNLYTGELGFLQTDVELQGKGPSIVLARDFRTALIDSFGRWSLSIPRIEVLVKTPSRTVLGTPGQNWQVVTYPNGKPVASQLRCTDFNMPYDELEDQLLWWKGGYQFTTERGEKQVLLRRSPEYSHRPAMLQANGSAYNFPLVTQQNWHIGCLSSTSNGELGEGFLAVSPDGTRYYLDYLVGVRTTDVVENDPGSSRPIFHGRMAATMFVSRIEDRFGNYLIYQYQGTKLVSINGSDGRSVSIQWRQDGVHRISAITVAATTQQPRTWQYQYDQYGLTAVILPDGSRWLFSVGNSPRPTVITQTCSTRELSSVVGPETTFQITAPSGLVGTFLLSGAYHARSYVPSNCVPSGAYAYEQNWPIFGVGSIIRKTFSGPGISTQTWNYNYSKAIGSTTRDSCASTNTCNSSRWVDVIDPIGNRTRYTLSTRWGATEGKTTSIEFFEGSAIKRTIQFNYASADQGPYPRSLGGAVDDYEADLIKNQTWTPVSATTITQDGTVFISTVSQFDTFARPIKFTKSSYPAR